MQLSQPNKKSLVNLTPLIDVVFILLIFFMLASNFIRWHYIELSVGESSDIEIENKNISIISISSEGTYHLNEKELPIEKIVQRVREQVRINIDHPVVVQPNKGADVQSLVKILNVLKDFAGNNISIAKSLPDHQ